MAGQPGSIERRVQEVAEALTAEAQGQLPRIVRSHRWELEVLRWCTTDPELRTRMLRFIDCLPALSDSRDVVRHLREYFPTSQRRLPSPLRWGLALAHPNTLTAPTVAAVTRYTASAIARLFLAGADLPEAAASLRWLEEQGLRLTVDLVGEATVSEKEADRYMERYLDLLRRWSEFLSSTPNISLKLSSLAFPFDPVDPEGTWNRVRPRLAALLTQAFSRNGFVHVDTEQFHTRDLTLGIVQRLLEDSFPQATQVGIVIQAYLRDAEEVTRRVLQWARRRGVPITIRLVRGAYWDTEVIASRQRNWPCPVFTEKDQTDAMVDRLTDLLFEHHDFVRIAIGTHNPRSIARAVARAEELHVPADHWECQMLYGMGLPLQESLRRLGIPLRLYTPIGELLPGMAYLVRRILENTSQYSFLAQGLLSHAV